jgi:hypothetical protein
MTYKEQIKESKKVLGFINDLKDQEVLEFTYGKGFNGEPNKYTLKCWVHKDGEISHSVWTNFSGMNVGSLSKTRVNCYTYDMMSQRTNYSFKLWEMEITKVNGLNIDTKGYQLTNTDNQ